MDNVNLYVLTTLAFDSRGNVAGKNVGVRFSRLDAEGHRAKGVQNEFERFSVSADWREDAETFFLGDAMLGFRFLVEEMQRAALR